MFDVVVIGGGVIGGFVLREVMKYKLSACLLEKASDVATGASKANSGIVHAGFDALPTSLKARFNVQGNKMMPSICAELGVKYKNNGSLVVAFNEEEKFILEELKTRGETNGVTGLEVIGRDKLRQLEPNISDQALCALYAPTGGIVCPYELTIATVGNAMDNGAELMLEFGVASITENDGVFTIIADDGRKVQAKSVINCAGINSGKIASLIGDDYFTVNARKGEYILIDRENSNFVNHTLFFTPTKLGKGILVSQTVDGNILLGPTAEERDVAETSTTISGMQSVISMVNKMCKKTPLYNTITSFAGVRAFSNRNDFIIEEINSQKGFVHCAGIESPGLTAAPAIGKYVVEEILSKILSLEINADFNGNRKPDYFFKNLSIEEKNEMIKREPAYGRIICRCEQITEGEILRALRENPKAKDVDGVKRRTRSGMGRCQGGFCQPYIVELIAKERGIKLTEVTKNGSGSELLSEVVK